MKKIWLILALVFATSIIGFFGYSFRPVKVYGKTYSAGATSLNLKNADIKSVKELADNLSPFKRLKKLDLGDFIVPAEDEELLISSFPNAEIKYRCCVMLFGNQISANETTLDLSKNALNDKEIDEKGKLDLSKLSE